MKKHIENSLQLTLEEYLPMMQSRIMECTSYFGVKTLKNPLDFWVYQEILFELRPDVLIEIGTNYGGSTLALAHLLDNIGNGRLVGIDIDQSKIPSLVREHPRIALLESDASECFEQVRSQIQAAESVLVIEDSSHTFENTLSVLQRYSQLIKPGGYLIVEDSICHHGLSVGPQPGPYEAIETFLRTHDEFESDRSRESFLISWNPKGFLRRKGN